VLNCSCDDICVINANVCCARCGITNKGVVCLRCLVTWTISGLQHSITWVLYHHCTQLKRELCEYFSDCYYCHGHLHQPLSGSSCSAECFQFCQCAWSNVCSGKTYLWSFDTFVSPSSIFSSSVFYVLFAQLKIISRIFFVLHVHMSRYLALQFCGVFFRNIRGFLAALMIRQSVSGTGSLAAVLGEGSYLLTTVCH